MKLAEVSLYKSIRIRGMEHSFFAPHRQDQVGLELSFENGLIKIEDKGTSHYPPKTYYATMANVVYFSPVDGESFVAQKRKTAEAK